MALSKVLSHDSTHSIFDPIESSDLSLNAYKMVFLGSGSSREVADVMLSRYACYLIAQNGDSRKEPIAFAQIHEGLVNDFPAKKNIFKKIS